MNLRQVCAKSDLKKVVWIESDTFSSLLGHCEVLMIPDDVLSWASPQLPDSESLCIFPTFRAPAQLPEGVRQYP